MVQSQTVELHCQRSTPVSAISSGSRTGTSRSVVEVCLLSPRPWTSALVSRSCRLLQFVLDEAPRPPPNAIAWGLGLGADLAPTHRICVGVRTPTRHRRVSHHPVSGLRCRPDRRVLGEHRRDPVDGRVEARAGRDPGVPGRLAQGEQPVDGVAAHCRAAGRWPSLALVRGRWSEGPRFEPGHPVGGASRHDRAPGPSQDLVDRHRDQLIG